jgi:hypothetical protein
MLSPFQNKAGNRIGCLLKWVVSGVILFFLYVSGFLAYRENSRIDQTAIIAESIRISFKAYADNNPTHRYPEDISDYAALRTIVNKHGGSLPEKQSDVAIKVGCSVVAPILAKRCMAANCSL